MHVVRDARLSLDFTGGRSSVGSNDGDDDGGGKFRSISNGSFDSKTFNLKQVFSKNKNTKLVLYKYRYFDGEFNNRFSVKTFSRKTRTAYVT